MRRLYAQIALGVMLAVIVGWIAVGLFVPRFRSMFEQELSEQLLGSGLRAVGARLDAAPPDEWPTRLAEARRELTIPLVVTASRELPETVRAQLSTGQAALARTGGAPSIYIPLRGGSQYLVAGPLRPPPVAPLVVTSLIFVLVLTITASAFVGVPLVRQIRSLRRAVGEIGGGNWAVRLDANAEGALSELADGINRMAAQLQRQFQEREALLQAVSHEIGTPLSRMRFQIELLDGVLRSPEDRARLHALGDDLNELDELSSELVSWMETDAGHPTRQTFELRPVLESLVELECQRVGEPLAVTLDVPAGVTIRADQRQFQRAIENLLRNAQRYASRQIVVDASASTDVVAIEVRDDGPGIPPDQRTRVLEAFARLDTPRSGAHRGVGLGLAIVRRIVESHGGSVTVGTAQEGGASLRTTWPRPHSAGCSRSGRRPKEGWPQVVA